MKARWKSFGILLLVLAAAVCAEEEERLFEANVKFKPNSSSKLLEISFDRQVPLSGLNQAEILSYKCFLQRNGSDLGLFVQNGSNDLVVPFTITQPYEPCQTIENLSIRCKIYTLTQSNMMVGVDNLGTVNVKSKEFSYEGSQDLLDYRCNMTVFYAVTIGNNPRRKHLSES